MANIRVRIRDANGGLPNVCMCCGEPATVTKSKNMSWYPPWCAVLIVAGILPWAIVVAMLTKRAQVQAPFCDDHKGHWLYRTLLLIGTFFLFTALGVGAFILAAKLEMPGRPNDYAGYACIGSAILGLIWAILFVVVRYTSVRPSEITDQEIVLDGVCDRFVNAVRADTRERRRDSRYDDDDDDDDDRRSRRGRY
jgi:hypothetical protein